LTGPRGAFLVFLRVSRAEERGRRLDGVLKKEAKYPIFGEEKYFEKGGRS